MNRPWMPLYVADYLADTAHLNAAESGAYLHLIMHYWQNGGLPSDERQLARIARMTVRQWDAAAPTLAQFFQDGWKHKRIEFELTEAARISAAGKAGGIASGKARRERSTNDKGTTVERPLNDQPTKCEALHSPSQREDSEPSGSAAEVVGEDPRAKLFRIGKTILVSFGVTEKRTGALIGQWLKTRNDPEGLLAAIQFARDQNVAEPVAYISAVLKQEKPNGTGQKSIGERAAELADEWRRREREAGLFRSDDDATSH